MSNYLDDYTAEDFAACLDIYVYELASGVCPEDKPSGYLLGGQSGAGKTLLHEFLKKKLNNNAIIINGDEYRSRHPHFREFNDRYGKDAVSHTAAWAGSMVEALIGRLSAAPFNLIIEGTLRMAEIPMDTARLLRSRGYDVSLALMAVKPEISLVSCRIRYEQMRRAGTTPRATDPAYHNKIVQDIVSNLAVLEDSGLFSAIYLYDRAERCLYPGVDGPSEADPRRASDVLQEKLFGEWTDQERGHLAFLNHLLETDYKQSGL